MSDSNTQTDDSIDLELTCWNCDTTFPSGTLGKPLGRGEATELCPTCGIGFSVPPTPAQDFDTIVRAADELPSHRLDSGEVLRRLPAVNAIVDDDIREAVIDLSAEAPAYFWRAPAANPLSEYHHPICRETHGLWAHTLMVAAVVAELAESHVEQGRLSITDRDHALAAAILHDQRKKGPHGTFEDSSVSDHDLQMAAVVREHDDLPKPVADAVAAHMGPWYDGPEPETPVEQLVHDADMVASTKNITCDVRGPVPTEIAELGVEVKG
jgi:putative nucleotidyltransferase with HDIG domain